jgi:hypothetical protein
MVVRPSVHPLAQDMRPHVSIAWTNGNAAPFLAGHAALASLRAASAQPLVDADCAASSPPADSAAKLVAMHAIASVSVQSVSVRIGQRTHSIELRAS